MRRWEQGQIQHARSRSLSPIKFKTDEREYMSYDNILMNFSLLGFTKKSHTNSTEERTQPGTESTGTVHGLQRGVILGSREGPHYVLHLIAWLFMTACGHKVFHSTEGVQV